MTYSIYESFALFIIAFAILGLILQKFREEQPSWLLRYEVFSEKLQGYWTPLFIFVAPLAFLYNVACTAVYAVITILNLLIKLLQWLYYWLWTRAFMWFWQNVIVIPIVLLANIIWHYLFKWPWRIYYQSYHTIWKSINRKTVKIGWMSATIAIFVAGFFKLLSITFDMQILELIGVVLCLIPISFGLGTVASMRSENDLDGYSMSTHKSRGIASATRAGKYIIAAISIVLIVFAISITGTFNHIGVVLLGATINISHVLGIIGVGVLCILAVMVLILPGYSIDNPKTNLKQEFIDLILLGRDKVLQYALASVFAVLFAGLIAIVPAFIVGGAFKGTTLIKEKVLAKSLISQTKDLEDIKKALASDTLDNEQWADKIHDKVSKHQVLSQIKYLSAFPMNIVEVPDMCLQVDTLLWIKNDFESMTSEYEKDKKQREQLIAQLDVAISDLETAISTEREERSTYLVQRSTDGKSWSTIGKDIAVRGYKDSNVDLKTAYRYRVIASNKSGNSRKSNVANAMTKDLTITSPSSFRASAESNFRVVLDWNDNSWNETGFLIERSFNKRDWSTVASLGQNIIRHIDSDISDTTYYYRLIAFSANDSSSSVISNLIRPSLAAPYVIPKKMTHDGVLIEWSHKDKYTAQKSTGKATENKAPAIDFEGMSTLDILLAKVKEHQLEQEDLRTQQAKEDEKMNPRLAVLSEIQGTTNASVIIRYIGYILGLLAMAVLAGLVVGFVLAYIGSLLWAIHQLTDGESYFFVDKIKEVRMQSSNQPLLGFLLLGLILSIAFITTSSASSSNFQLPDMNGFGMEQFTDAEDELEEVVESITVEENTEEESEVAEEKGDVVEEKGDVVEEIMELGKDEFYIIKGDEKSLYRELLKKYNNVDIQLILDQNPDWESKDGIAGEKLIIPKTIPNTTQKNTAEEPKEKAPATEAEEAAARATADAEALRKAAEEAVARRAASDAEARRKAEEEAAVKAEAEAEARRQAEEEAGRKAEEAEAAKAAADAEAKRKADEAAVAKATAAEVKEETTGYQIGDIVKFKQGLAIYTGKITKVEGSIISIQYKSGGINKISDIQQHKILEPKSNNK